MKMHENEDNKDKMHVDAMLRCPVPFSYMLKNLHTRRKEHHLQTKTETAMNVTMLNRLPEECQRYPT